MVTTHDKNLQFATDVDLWHSIMRGGEDDTVDLGDAGPRVPTIRYLAKQFTTSITALGGSIVNAASWLLPATDIKTSAQLAALAPAAGDRHLLSDGLFADRVAEWTGTDWNYGAAPRAGQMLSLNGLGLVYRRALASWQAYEAHVDMIADPSSSDVSGAVNDLVARAAAISPLIPIVFGPCANGWRIVSSLVSAALNRFVTRGSKIVWAGVGAAAIVYGATAPGNPIGAPSVGRYDLHLERETTDYGDKNVGIHILNVADIQLNICVRYFWKAINIHGDTTGSQYCNIDASDFYGCCKGWGLQSDNTGGWSNEHTLKGGRVSHNIPSTTEVAAAVSIIKNGGINGTKIIGQSIELADSPTGGTCVMEVTGTASGGPTGLIMRDCRIDGGAVGNGNLDFFRGTLAPTLSHFGPWGYINPNFKMKFNNSVPAQKLLAAANKFDLGVSTTNGGKYEPVVIARLTREQHFTSGGKVQAPGNAIFANCTGGVVTWSYEASTVTLSSDAVAFASATPLREFIPVDCRNIASDEHRKVTLRVNYKASGTPTRLAILAIMADGSTAITSTDDINFSRGGIAYSTSSLCFQSGANLAIDTSDTEIYPGPNVAAIFVSPMGSGAWTDIEVIANGGSGIKYLNDFSWVSLGAVGFPLSAYPLAGNTEFYSKGIPSDTTPAGTIVKNRSYAAGHPTMFESLGGGSWANLYDPSNAPVIACSGQMGFTTGSGGTKVQTVSKVTSVQLNHSSGTLTTFNDALAAGASATFTFTNSVIGALDVVLPTLQSAGATADAYEVKAAGAGAGSCRITLKNVSAGSLSEAVNINFVVIKGSNT